MKCHIILYMALSARIGKHMRLCPGLELAVIILCMCVSGAQEGPWMGGEDSPGPSEQVFEVHVCSLVGKSFLPSAQAWQRALEILKPWLKSKLGTRLFSCSKFSD